MQDSLRLTVGAKWAPMSCEDVLKTRVPRELKLQAKEIADRELLSEAAWLKTLVLREIRSCREAKSEGRECYWAESSARRGGEAHGHRRRGRSMLMRLRHEDKLLLDARADARGMRPATYAAVLIRAHLRKLAPLPKEELLALKRCIGELASIGRNINQIARSANDGGQLPSSISDEFRAMLRMCEALRDSTKELLKANVASWESGHVEDV